MQLSENFHLSEMLVSQTASRKGFSEQYNPPQKVIDNLRKVCVLGLQKIRDHYERPLIVTSGYRCLRVNRAIGSSDGSDHVQGYAADFTVPGVPNLALAKWIQLHINYDQLILEFGTLRNPSWIHLSLNPRGRNQILRIGGEGLRVLTRSQLQAL
jgi:hypothetical protein